MKPSRGLGAFAIAIMALGGPGGLLVSATVGGIAGHELAHNRRKRCG